MRPRKKPLPVKIVSSNIKEEKEQEPIQSRFSTKPDVFRKAEALFKKRNNGNAH